MATINSAGSGNWSTGGTWVGGVAPGTADDAVILNTHTVTLNTTGLVAKSLTINSGGKLSCSTSANWGLTVQSTITAASGSEVAIDISGSSIYTGALLVNAARSTTDLSTGFFAIADTAKITLKGYPRKRITTLSSGISASATSATVADATGWKVGDTVVFATTQAFNATPKTDVVTLTSVSGGNIGWSGGVTYDHAAGGYVGNFSSNLSFGPATAGDRGQMKYTRAYGTSSVKLIDNLLFNGCATQQYDGYGCFSTNGASATMRLTVSNCSFWDFRNAAIVGFGFVQGCEDFVTSNNVFYSENEGNASYRGCVSLSRCVVSPKIYSSGCFRLNATSASVPSTSPNGALFHVSTDSTGISMEMSDCFWSGGSKHGMALSTFNGKIDRVDTFSNKVGITLLGGSGMYMNDIGIGYFRGNSAANETCDVHGYSFNADIVDSLVQTLSLTSLSSALASHRIGFVNKNKDVTAQEEYTSYYAISRENSIKNRSTSSIKIKPSKVSTDCTKSITVPCRNGSTITIVGYIQIDSSFYNSGDCTCPTVTISGLGITPVVQTATSAANGAWEKFQISATNNVAGYDGNFTVTFTANAKTVVTGSAYFSGVAASPYVVACRHYGFVFDETNPLRTIDPYVVAAEATASAYTGVTLNNATKSISFSAGTADTAQKFYDYSRWWCCDDVSREVPFARAGSLFSLGSGWKVTDPYYTNTLTWGGGTVELTSTGTKTLAIDSSIIKFTTAGSYNLSNCTLSGTVELVNTSGGSVTVNIPAGTSYTNTGPNITVNLPQSTMTVSANVSLVGAEVRVYDLDASGNYFGTELAGVESNTGATFEYVGGSVGNTLAVQIMLDGYEEIVQQHTIGNTTETLNINLMPDNNA